ncbi:MAG: hypothetical protein IJQ32_07970 [Paludibacteraceae bacterium]|nr:hypothetical protein [Paludibacteraceae bacterium]
MHRTFIFLLILSLLQVLYCSAAGDKLLKVEVVNGDTINHYDDGSYAIIVHGIDKTEIYKYNSKNFLFLYGCNRKDGKSETWLYNEDGNWMHFHQEPCACLSLGGKCPYCLGAGGLSMGYFSMPCSWCKGTGRCQQKHDKNGCIEKIESSYMMQTMQPYVPSNVPVYPSPSQTSDRQCTECHGTGNCSKCNGKGWYNNPYATGGDGIVKCTVCPGHTGKCWKCNGTGRIR